MNYSFTLPPNLIAKYPVKPRDASKLMCIDKSTGAIQEHIFYELSNMLQEGDVLIFNNTKVEARRVKLYKIQDPSIIFDVLFLENNKTAYWLFLTKKKKNIKMDDILVSVKNPKIKFKAHEKDNTLYLIEPFSLTDKDFLEIGEMPIPPYFERQATQDDILDYQSIFAKISGSIAAPTASLHFTKNLIETILKKNITIHFVNLKIGYGTFAPLRHENYIQNSLHEEQYEITEDVANFLKSKQYNRLIAVGTTTLRVLETVWNITNGQYNSHLQGKTNIFLRPPYKIKSIDGLITNFHLPDSSLLLLTSCILENTYLQTAYQQAIANSYRFYSYGDAMLIL